MPPFNFEDDFPSAVNIVVGLVPSGHGGELWPRDVPDGTQEQAIDGESDQIEPAGGKHDANLDVRFGDISEGFHLDRGAPS